MPEPTTPPALTQEEWKIGMTDRHPEAPWGDVAFSHWGVAITGLPYYTRIEDRHACAALCLYGQSYGFTQEDVEILRDVAHRYSDGLYPDEAGPIASIANRIAALLPPPEDAR